MENKTISLDPESIHILNGIKKDNPTFNLSLFIREMLKRRIR